MKTIGILAVLFFCAAPPIIPQTTPALSASDAAGDYEELPELKASEILKPEFLKGQYHTVREPVPTSSGTNQFVIDSEFGVFDADGNEMLVRRVKEIYAIARLKEVSRTDQFKDSLGAAAKGTFNAAKKVVEDPANAISNVPKGVMKFMGRAGQSLKNVGKKKEAGAEEGSKVQQTIGYSKKKREIAVSMGIDPYSTNAVLQKELDGVTWASWAGGFAFSAGTFPISGPVGVGLTVTSVSDSLDKMVNEKPPADLKAINGTALRNMGVGEKETDRFLSDTAFSPTQQTAFVLNLKSLDGVANRAGFVRTAAEKSSTESDAVFCVQTAALMSKLHQSEMPLAKIETIGDFPIAVAKDGTTVVALQWDYAAWTAGAAGFTDLIQKFAAEAPRNKKVLVALSGQTSEQLRHELETRKIQLKDRYQPGPLK